MPRGVRRLLSAALESRSRSSALVVALLITVILVVVWKAGGARTPFPQLMYFPVALAALWFGVAGGVIAGLVGGLLVGPAMPFDVLAGSTQPPSVWLLRLSVLVLVGALVGAFVDTFRRWLRSAELDSETALPNIRRLERTIRERQAAAEESGVVSLDFTNINKVAASLGMSMVPRVIREMSDRLKRLEPKDRSIYHYHPFRLALLPRQRLSDEQLQALVHEARRPLQVGDLSVFLDACSGYVADGRTIPPLELIQEADLAASRAGAMGADFQLGGSATDRDGGEVELLAELAQAIEKNRLELHYQPKIGLEDDRCVGAEALLRWCHPERGWVAPGLFIPLAEETSLIEPLTKWVLRQALDDARSFVDSWGDFTVAVNVSARNIRDPDFPGGLSRLLADYGVAPRTLEIEITESALMRNPEASISVLEALRGLGVATAIDDFGSGYSSLEYLGRLPIPVVKIGKGFLDDDSPRMRIIARATVDLAHALGLDVVAEGVETAEAYDWLKTVRFDYAQGYHMSPPLPVGELREFIQGQPP